MTKQTQIDLNLDSEVLSECGTLVRDAEQYKPGAVPALRQFLKSHPEIWTAFGDLGHLALETWLQMIAGPDALLLESVRLKIGDLRKELQGEAPSPLEKLLVERILATKLQLDHAETVFAQAKQIMPMQLSMLEKRLNGAQHRHLRAINALATLRKLTRPAFSPLQLAGVFAAKKAPSIARRNSSLLEASVSVAN